MNHNYNTYKSEGPILAAIPLPYHDGDAFWGRDMGLTVQGLRYHGIDARVVAFGMRENHAANLPLVLGSLEDFENPEWWQRLNPSGVIFTGWSAPRYDRIRKAILSATPNVIERLDTDGVRSPQTWFAKYCLAVYGACYDSKSILRRISGPFYTIFRACVLLAFPNLLDRKMAVTMAQMKVLAAESPLAAARMKRLLLRFVDPIPKVVCIPHPVAEDYMQMPPRLIKGNRIVSVGRWNSYQKNFPVLIDVITRFLRIYPEWSADIIGELPKKWDASQSFSDDNVRHRIRFHGKIPHRQLSSLYQTAKIYFMSSRYESFNIAAGEALCCGCSVVGSGDIASVPFFAGELSGTVVCRQTSDHFLDALSAEVDAWETGRRNPEKISKSWRSIVGSRAVAKAFINCFESIGSHE